MLLYCQIYLKVMTLLADICNGTGRYILPDIWVGKMNQTFTSGYNWPNRGDRQKRLDTWQLALCQAFPVDNLLQLIQSLGKWLQLPNQATHRWHWLTSYSTQKLYHWNGQWQIHAKHSNCNPKY